jgi:hypothetical protein
VKRRKSPLLGLTIISPGIISLFSYQLVAIMHL